jgi:fucose 4-O-acetylase-like acetyltransferase
MRKRLDWVDFCKGIGIIGVIISHCAAKGTFPRSFLFSFHMPLFFILSGYTMRPTKTRKDLARKTVRDLKNLILPVLIFSAIRFLVIPLFENNFSFENYDRIWEAYLDRLLWCTGETVGDHPYIGMMWFLVSLFTARLIINSMSLFLNNKQLRLFLLFIGGFGIFLGATKHYLPFNFDVSLASLLFIACGMLLKRYRRFFQKYLTPIFITCLGIWIIGLRNDWTIVMDERVYGGRFLVEVFVSIAACFVVIELVKAISKTKSLSKCMTFVGRNSLTILYIHYLDVFVRTFWMGKGTIRSAIVRFAFTFGIFALLIIIRKILFRRRAVTAATK